MNLLLLKNEDFTGPGVARISGRRFEHVRKVLRLKAGDALKAGLLNGCLGEAEITAIDGSAMELSVPELVKAPPAPSPLALVVSLPRPQSLKKLLHFTASSGVKELYLISSARVEKSYWTSSALSPEAIAEEVELGLEQGVDTIPPKIEFRRKFAQFVCDELPGLFSGRLKFIAHPGPYPQCPPCGQNPSVLALGPEGGFIDSELEAFSRAGFQPVSAGEHILRVEFAAAFIAGLLLQSIRA